MKHRLLLWSLLVLLFIATTRWIVSAQIPLSVTQASQPSALQQSMRVMLQRECQTLTPIHWCGIYQQQLSIAEQRAAQLLRTLQSYPVSQQNTLLQWLLQRLSLIFQTSSDTNTKVIAAYYYLYFWWNLGATTNDPFLDFLFDGTTTTTWWLSAQWRITNIFSLWQNTRINNTQQTITMMSNHNLLQIWVQASQLQAHATYRLVAQLDWSREVYWATNQSQGMWHVFLWEGIVRQARSVTFTLICQECSGPKFSGSTFGQRAVVDSVQYSLLTQSWSVQHDPWYTHTGRLELSRVDATYFMQSYRLEIHHTTTLTNRSSTSTVGLDDLRFTLFVDGVQLPRNTYTIRYEPNHCNRNYFNAAQFLPVTMRTLDQCRFDTTIWVDNYTIPFNSLIEVVVDPISRGWVDHGSSANSVSFRVWR